MEITKRELIASVSILAIMITIGLLIGGKINENHQDKIVKYNKAFKISKDEDLFEYAMKTNVGNAFVEGIIKAVDPISHEDVEGEYLKIKRVKERYTRHTRTVTTRVNGKTRTRTEVYWSWDAVGSTTYTANKLTFLKKTFDVSKFDLNGTSYLNTVKVSHNIRYKYYGLDKEFKATVFGTLKDNTIEGKNIYVYKDVTISEILEELDKNVWIFVFWILWIIATLTIIYLFVTLDNDWLNKNKVQ